MTDEVLFTQEGHLGLITLNRASALNALTLPMILAIQQQLEAWKTDATVYAVVLCATSGAAFCAGGDVRWLYEAGKTQNPEQMNFFWHEYRMNHFIHHFGKPYIALMDGMTMGGGVGVSMHGSHPVASERFVFAMPETGIGFFPDIGASYLLNRCPDSLGIYLGLTGNRLDAEQALHAGLVKEIVHSEKIPSLIQALSEEDLSDNAHARVTACLKQFAEQPVAQQEKQTVIHQCFSKPTIEEISSSLKSSEDPQALGLDKILSKKSPLSLKVTLAQLQKTKGLTLAQCLKIDYDLVGHFMRGSDFYEGVRALLIDKDKNPQWQPARLESVTEQMVVDTFERSQKELEFIEQ